MKFAKTRLAVVAMVAFAGSAGAATLTCAVTPGGTTFTTPTPGGCGSDLPNPEYGASWAVTGLAPGTYTFQWWISSYGPNPQPDLSCSSSTCSQSIDAWLNQVNEVVSVTVTNTSTHATETLSSRIKLKAVCTKINNHWAWC